MRTMRKIERQVTGPAAIKEIVAGCEVMRVAFNDPEEELRQIDTPQQVIDSRKAYRDPVYPRGWNKSEGNGE